MICRNCDHENPEENRFCGNCGAALVERKVASSVPAQVPPRGNGAGYEPPLHQPSEEPPLALHGPSFLGLSDAPGESRDLAYLYEEPRSDGGWRIALALVLVLAFAAFVAWEWRQNPSWQTAILHWPGVNRLPAPASASAPTAAPVVAQPAANNPNSAAAPAPDSPQGNTAPQNSGPEATDKKPAATDTGTKADETGAANSDKAAVEADQSAMAKDAAKDATSEDEDTAAEQQLRNAGKSHAPARAARENPGEETYARAQDYLYGRNGLAKNCNQAVSYLRTAANMGNAKARSQLGGLYATGHCVPLDRAQAYEWFTLAHDADHGRDSLLERNRRMLWSQMSEDERQRAMAMNGSSR